MTAIGSPAVTGDELPAPQLRGDDVLDKLLDELPIGTWRYQGEPTDTYHLGPYAQDWRAVFAMNDDDTVIPVVDGIGVSLVSIQALGRRVRRIEARQRWIPLLAVALYLGARTAARRL